MKYETYKKEIIFMAENDADKQLLENLIDSLKNCSPSEYYDDAGIYFDNENGTFNVTFTN